MSQYILENAVQTKAAEIWEWLDHKTKSLVSEANRKPKASVNEVNTEENEPSTEELLEMLSSSPREITNGRETRSIASKSISRGEYQQEVSYAAWMLGNRKEIKAIPLLMQCLEARCINDLGVVIGALGNIGATEAVPLILQLLSESRFDQKEVLWNAVWALSVLGDRCGVASLIQLMQRARGRFRKHIALCLQQLTGKTFGDNYQQWRAWWEKEAGMKREM